MSCERCGAFPQPYHVTVVKDKEEKVWLACNTCYYEIKQDLIPHRFGEASMVATDSIPGGLEVKHGICWPDGTPRRFDSKSDIKRAAFNAGLTIGGETPKVNHRLRDAKESRAT
jgi:hypothetical protein